MALIQSTAIPSGATDYELEQSLKTNDGDSAYLSWTPASAGNQRTWTWSGWVKRGELGSVNTIFGAGNGGTIFDEIRFDASDRLEWFTYASSLNGKRVSTAIYRDTSAWYHILAVYDSTDSTEADRMKLYVNGQQLTSFDATTHPSQNHQGNINNNILHAVGAVYAGQLYNPYDGYLAEVNFIDGQALTPADFGKTGTYGEWKPIEYSGTYGTNGFYLPFKQDYTVEGFSTVTYKGTGTSQYVGGTGFKPSLSWIKMRSSAYNHRFFDAIRGSANGLYSPNTNVEGDYSAYDGVTSFDTDGFSLSGKDGTDKSGETYVAWNWDMGADTPTGFGAVAYTGNGSTQNISGFNFSPDLVWAKSRGQAYGHQLYDSVRGATKRLQSNDTSSESTQVNNLKAFNNDGFTLGSDAGINQSGDNVVAWGWDMGGTTATNTSGSENSTVRANPTYGQSIVSYVGKEVAGTTYGHGLNSAPEFIIVKNLSRSSNWKVYYGDNTKALALNTSGTPDDQTYYWNDTSPTSSVFTVGGGTDTNGNDENLVAYCFHSVSGYSKIGSYTANNSSTGPSVTTGFRPAFVIIKDTEAGNNWITYDNVRDPINPNTAALFPDSSQAEAEYGAIDFNDTGFQIKSSVNALNAGSRNYIYMAFADKREYAYWLDQSGNNNDWTSNNLTESDISVDSPTNNFATWNPLDKGDQVTVAEGNTQLTFSGTAGHSIRSTFSMSSGKWYCEIYVGDNSSLGIIKQNAKIVPSSGSLWPGANGFGSGGSYAYAPDGRIVTNSSYSSYGTNPVAGDILGIAFDSDNGKIYFSLNGVWQNSSNPESATNPAYTGISGTFAFAAGYWTTPGSNKVILNCGQDSSFAGNKTAQGNQDSNDIGDFYYTPPTGFLALCTKNLPDVDVVPSEHFNTVLYTGNGSDNRSIGLVGFQPDWLWIKERSSTSSHILSDAVRGATKQLKTNSTGAESSNADEIQAFESDGFQLGTEGSVNENTQTYVAWNWKANGSGSSNTNGSITSTVSANVDAGFSIVSYTGDGSSLATIGHGLSKAPELIHIKNRTDSDSWISFTTVIDGSLDYMYLNLTNAKADLAIATPTSSVFSVDSGNQINGSGDAHIAYCFHSVDGYSKVGSYTGNGNVDGTFVYTGFRPAFVIIKYTDSTANWIMWDNKRNPSNVTNLLLKPNLSNAENTTTANTLDFTSNGFKCRGTDSGSNDSGGNYIYIAFAESPFKYSNAR
jgi:hypothetical protein